MPGLAPGVYPAAVTPFDDKGRVDMPGVARLLSWYEAAGCKGAVLAGTNGEGPSLSAVEKRDLIQGAMPLRGKLELILGIATPSLDEAVWLTRRAHEAGAAAVLVMAPFYFRDAGEDGIAAWFLQLMDKSPLPVLVYNFPQKTGITIGPELMARLSEHERFTGLKDSSGSRENLAGYRDALQSRSAGALMFVGNEELLVEALDAGWTGTISGAANVIPNWLTKIIESYTGDRARAEVKFELVLPCISALRSYKQPALNKALLAALGVIPRPDVRAPLTPTQPDEVAKVRAVLEERLGMQFGEPSRNLTPVYGCLEPP
jgi:4-hydroxy-tetrahydrodipicolinate synthase